MRMRHKPYARPELNAWDRFVPDPTAQKGLWKNNYANTTLPLRVELGCGKGLFLGTLGLREPDYNYLGIDIKSEMLVAAKRTVERLYFDLKKPINNLLITIQNIEKITGILSVEDGIERIYINFCNPWYKSGHAKHRLTHPRQLAQYRDLFKNGGEIWFKTDDDPLFNDSLRYFKYAGFSVEWLTRDLHKEEPTWNIRTEHETMFAQEGIPIKALIAKMQPAVLDREVIARLKNL